MRRPGRDEVREEYARRLAARRETLARQELRERRIADARLLVFIAGLVVSWLAFWAGRISGLWLLAPAGAFTSLIVWHERARRACRRAARATAYYEAGLSRLDDRWAGKGVGGERFLDPEHPYAADLDLFGAGSLFERLCTARTPSGEERLASWLLGPATPEEIVARQEAVAELRPRLDLREDLELLGTEVRAGIDPVALADWGRTGRVFQGWLLPTVAGVLGVLAVLTLVVWLVLGISASPFLLVVCLDLAFLRLTRKHCLRVFSALEERTHDLVLLAALLKRLETEPFATAKLRGLRAALEDDGSRASLRIGRLARLLHLLETLRNQLFAPIGFLLLWPVHLARAIDAWRIHSGPAIAGWLDAVGEFEALSALASYAFENPDDPFPEVVDTGACFEAEAVGHPLIPDASCVRNDLALGGAVRVLAVSGSNMSGKSTLLRTVGINTVLALAGAPVRARRLVVSPLAIGATLRIQDSLQAGRSRFYAEITRVRQLVEISRGPLPLLFLLDEIFAGTNSHDRRIGAEAIVRGLIERGAIGLVTTHDLALTDFADTLAPRAVNVHFEDHFENGTMHFDYCMRPGVVRKSNALALMRAVGLEV